MTWREQAACQGYDPDLWWPDGGAVSPQAVQICRTCPVRQHCATENRHEREGIWFGTYPTDRDALRRRRTTLEAIWSRPLRQPRTVVAAEQEAHDEDQARTVERDRDVAVAEVVEVVCDHYGCTEGQLLSGGLDWLRARNVAIWVAREDLGLSLQQIGVRFELHHTTVLNALRRFDSLLVMDSSLERDVEAVRWLLRYGREDAA